MLNSDTVNENAWDNVYQSQPRREYPDLMLIHLLARYAFAGNSIKAAAVIGCADGAEAIAIARRGPQVACIDFIDGAVERARKFAAELDLLDRLTFHVADQRNISAIPDSSLDLVVSWSVISYLDEAEVTVAIAEIARILRPGGTFVGLLEGKRSSIYQVEGAKKLGDRTFFVPNVSASVEGCVMTFFDEEEVRKALASFEITALNHRSIETLLPEFRNVSQWMFCANLA